MDFLKKPIYKSRTNQKIDGVCAGIAKAMDIDRSWVRLLFVVLLAFGGFGGVLYILLDCALDKEPIDYIQ